MDGKPLPLQESKPISAPVPLHTPPAPNSASSRASAGVDTSASTEDTGAVNLDGCAQVYLDIGSNIGVQVRKLFEPHLYPAANVISIFSKVFGPPEHRQLPSAESGLCAVGFEANPMRVPRLKELEAAYKRIWSLLWEPVSIFYTARLTPSHSTSPYLTASRRRPPLAAESYKTKCRQVKFDLF